MDEILHGAIIEDFLHENFKIEEEFKLIGFKEENNLKIKIVRFSQNEMKTKIKKLQKFMIVPEAYMYIYDNNDRLIFVFKEKVFYILKSKETWTSMIEYAKSLNIPEETFENLEINFKEDKKHLIE
jgi:hypothetical protein